MVKTQDPTIDIAKVTITDGECDESNQDIRRVVYMTCIAKPTPARSL
ncbi:MAG: hypothetical protein IKP73_07030 [Bacteroidales bacterium]|nr:hypothetical protein [Bacteroidales bacterium]